MDQMIIPFGKYNGQPVDVLQADPGYCQWLMSQDWFRERYSTINTLIVNNFTKPEDTPEHNTLQAKFLDDDFIDRFEKLYFGITTQKKKELSEKYAKQYEACVNAYKKEQEVLVSKAQERKESNPDAYKYEKEPVPTDALIYCHLRFGEHNYRYRWLTKTTGIGNLEDDHWVKPDPQLCSCAAWSDPDSDVGDPFVDKVEFEVRGWDVVLDHGVFGKNVAYKTNYEETLNIEIKPALGDDYPSILRQMKANLSNKQFYVPYNTKCLLLYKDFTASGATEDQVREIFHKSGFRTMSFKEIEGETA